MNWLREIVLFSKGSTVLYCKRLWVNSYSRSVGGDTGWSDTKRYFCTVAGCLEEQRGKKGGREKRALQLMHDVWSTARVSLHARKNLIETYQSLVSLIIRQEGGVRRCAGKHLIRVHRALVVTTRRRHHWNIATGKALLVSTRSHRPALYKGFPSTGPYVAFWQLTATSTASFSAFGHSWEVVEGQEI